MFLRKFKSTGPDVIALIFIIMVLIWIGPLLHPELPSSMGFDEKPMPLFRFLLSICGQSPLLNVLLTFFIVLFVAFLIVNFNTSDFFISERTFLPAVIYVLLSGFFPEEQIMNPALPAAVFLILAVRKIMESYKNQYTAYSFFDAGLLISCGGLFYANFMWFSLLLLIGIILLRTGNLKEIVISILGLAAPWFITFGFWYVAGNDPAELFDDIKYNMFADTPEPGFPALTIVAIVIAGLIFLVSVLNLISIINTKKIKSRKTFRLLIWAFIIAVCISLVINPLSREMFWIAGIPASYIIAHFFIFTRRRLMPEILFSILFILVTLIQIADLFPGS